MVPDFQEELTHFFSVDKTENRCPTSHPYSFLQNNWCCSTNDESSKSYLYLEDNCNGGELVDDSVCCAEDIMECPNKPCFDNLPNLGEENGLHFTMLSIAQRTTDA